MLKLKYLFDNIDLATMIVKNWNFDASSLNLFANYRISSNAVYPFECREKRYYLRFAPASEKSLANLQAERDFVKYLGENQYPALKYKSSLSGNDIEMVSTPWGKYYASAFEGVKGVSLEDTEMTEAIAECYGRHLGLLHQLSAQYAPVSSWRWSYEDVLNWIERELLPFENETLARKEVKLLKEAFASLPKSPKTFGLIHYDFELDNVFYELQTGLMSVIDFDDAMYSWYAKDIEQALDSLESEVGDDCFARLQASFLLGYRSMFDLSDDMLACRPLFRRFINLYGYARIIRAAAESWPNEPPWMTHLRSKLDNSMRIRAGQFGQPLHAN